MYRTYRDTETGGFVTKKDGEATFRFQNGRIENARFVVDYKSRQAALATGIKSHHAYIEHHEPVLFRAEGLPGLPEAEVKYSLQGGHFYFTWTNGHNFIVERMAGPVELTGGKVFLAND